MSGIFNSSIFNSEIFNTDAEAAETISGGKGDNAGRRKRKTLHLPFKPTGIVDRPARKDIERRVAESREIAAEVAGKIASGLALSGASEATEGAGNAAQVSLSAMDLEIRDLMQEEMQMQDLTAILVLLAAAA